MCNLRFRFVKFTFTLVFLSIWLTAFYPLFIQRVIQNTQNHLHSPKFCTDKSSRLIWLWHTLTLHFWYGKRINQFTSTMIIKATLLHYSQPEIIFITPPLAYNIYNKVFWITLFGIFLSKLLLWYGKNILSRRLGLLIASV